MAVKAEFYLSNEKQISFLQMNAFTTKMASTDIYVSSMRCLPQISFNYQFKWPSIASESKMVSSSLASIHWASLLNICYLLRRSQNTVLWEHKHKQEVQDLYIYWVFILLKRKGDKKQATNQKQWNCR